MIRTLKTFKKQLVRILSLFILMSVIGCISSGAKNIAFRRVVYQSSAINFDATGQLVTDGIFTINKNDSISQNEKLDSRWISKTNQNEWIYIDLGIISRISEIKLHWDSENFASKYEIQISDNAKAWDTIYSNQNGNGGTEHCCVKNIKARFVRLNCITGKSEHFSLVEMEVFGTNDLNIQSNLVSNPLVNGIQYLRDGNWVVERASQVSEPDGVVLSSSYFDDSNWLPAKVPGTVLTSYLQAGAIADPNYGDQQKLISDSYFTADFWYRNKFVIPSSQQGKTTWLNFNAINWKADVYFNGNYLGHIDGAFIRGQFNISEYVNWGGDNYLAVLIHKNDTPGEVTVQTKEYTGPNGGLLGADSPTIHASVGWDWLPTIRGRNIGIYDDVYISYTQDVQLRNPWVLVDLDTETKDFSKAELTVKTEIRNSSSNRQDVVVKGKIQPSGLEFQSPVFTLAPNENREVVVAKVVMENPHLWWPNTYGEPFLYDMEMAVLVNDICSDSTNFQFGVRKFTYDTQNALAVYCNGTRIICRGGIGEWMMEIWRPQTKSMILK